MFERVRDLPRCRIPWSCHERDRPLASAIHGDDGDGIARRPVNGREDAALISSITGPPRDASGTSSEDVADAWLSIMELKLSRIDFLHQEGKTTLVEMVENEEK
ncbi:hypothetical protein HYFRA_00003883 [Hymenoscyphus fraxineus]|uniref:Uncharacterized protein n=1 Tax=Hymenoscyphus fraxineus TaxID=746836 RepID=A0A9N9PWD7_9HELO|nr:hypothetical protein HYFRA_00003883 [Hymenoscyphus fraxineus]